MPSCNVTFVTAVKLKNKENFYMTITSLFYTLQGISLQKFNIFWLPVNINISGHYIKTDNVPTSQFCTLPCCYHLL